MARIFAAVGLLAMLLAGQTQVDIEKQGKRTDFLRPPFARPVRSGSELPTACEVGELYFRSTAPAGGNLHVCHSENEWAPQGSAGQGTVTIENDGSVVGVRPTVNFTPGLGILQVAADTGADVEIEHAIDTAVVLTKSHHQAGDALRCESTEVLPNQHECTLSPDLNLYTPGMVFFWTPGEDIAAGAATLEIDQLGAVPIKLSDGVTDPGMGDFVSGTQYPVWYDGNSFRSFPAQVPNEYLKKMEYQNGAGLYCESTETVDAAFTCEVNPELSGYTRGMVIHWRPDVDVPGGPTALSIGELPAQAVTLSDGVSNPGPGMLRAGELYLLWHDGFLFRVIGTVSSGYLSAETFQSGAPLFCESSGTQAEVYACQTNPPLTRYQRGMLIHWVPDVDSSGGPLSLEINQLGAVGIKSMDGISDPIVGEIRAGILLTLWFDGTGFRLAGARLARSEGTERPPCNVEMRGRTWFSPGASGENDQYAICTKNQLDQLEWRLVY